MFRTKIIYRLIIVLLIFASLVVIPFSFTIVKQVNKMISEEEAIHPAINEDYLKLHKEFTPKLIEQMVPYAFYILIMAFMLSIFFMRKMLFSIKQLQKGSKAIKDGNLDINLEITSEDELGEVTRAFNEMTSSLKKKTSELQQKDIYVNAMLDPLWVVDDNNNIIDINNAFTRLFGHEREGVIGASIYDFFDEKNALIMRQELENKRDKGLSSIYEISILTKEGVQIPVLISGSPIYSGDKIVGKIGIFKDFREQKELRNQLQQSRDYIETIMDSIQDEIIVVDREYRIVKANKIAAKNKDVPVIGRLCYQVFHNYDRPCWAEGYECPAQNVFITGRSHRSTRQHVDEMGKSKYSEVVASPIIDTSGNVLHAIELIRDITERKQHEDEIFKKNRELVALNNISSILSRSLRPDEIFSRVLDKMIDMLNMDGGGIFFIDEIKKEMTCHYHRGISDEYVRMLGRIRLGEDIPGKVAVTGQIITTSDLPKDNRIERSIMKHSGIRGYSCIPIRGKERIIGVFCLFSFRTHFFTVEEENILNSIGEMSGIALENIKLYEKMRELYEYQRKRREDEHIQLLSLSTKLGSSIELKGILEQILGLMKDFFRADFVWLLTIEAEGNFMLKSSTSGMTEDKIVYQKGISSIEGYAIEKQRPMVISDITSEERFYFPEELNVRSFQSIISVPMLIGNKPIGAFTLFYQGVKNFKEEETHFLEIIANILAVSLERSELYRKSIMEKGLADTVLQSVADSIITIDNNGKIISINRTAEELTGYPFHEAIGLPVCDILRYDEENTDFRLLFGDCFEAALSGNSISKEGEMVTVSGRRISVLINSAPVRNSEGQVIAAVNLLRDISREKEIDRIKTDLIRSVSHEFRTPLSAIVGMTEMVLEGDIEESKAQKYLGTILSEGVRLSNMVSDLLNIARIESGSEKIVYKAIDIISLLKEIEDSFSAVIEKKKATLKFDIHLDGVFIGDEEKIKQLLMNIIDNSLTFSDDHCIIIISVDRIGDDIEIAVSDNGWGISEDDLIHLTERFYRGKHGERVKGTGLGLSLCKEIVKMHGGRINIKSKPGKGTEVFIHIPYRGKNE